MSKEKINNNSPNINISQLSKENEILEEIINSPLLLKDIEGLEEEEEYEDSIPEENELKEKEIKNHINKKSSKIHKNIIENLLIDLFEYHYNEISTEKKYNLGNKIYELKRNIEYYYNNLDDNFSKYILLILEQKIYELIEYVEKLIDIKVNSAKDILEIKNSLKLTGNDIVKIFEKPFQKTMKFDISSVLVVLFISDILSENKINFTDEEYDQIVEAESFNEKDRFEKYIEECKSYFEKIQNGEIEEDIEVYYEEEKENENNEVVNDIYNNLNEEINNENDNDNDNINMSEEKKDSNNNNNNEFIEEKKDDFIVEDIIDKNKSSKYIDSIFDENNTENVVNIINNNFIDKNNKNTLENKTEKFSNIEDLLKYINGNDNKKKRKKKRKIFYYYYRKRKKKRNKNEANNEISNETNIETSINKKAMSDSVISDNIQKYENNLTNKTGGKRKRRRRYVRYIKRNSKKSNKQLEDEFFLRYIKEIESKNEEFGKHNITLK